MTTLHDFPDRKLGPICLDDALRGVIVELDYVYSGPIPSTRVHPSWYSLEPNEMRCPRCRRTFSLLPKIRYLTEIAH